MNEIIKQAIRDELDRQNQISRADGLYVYDEEEDVIGVDGRLNIAELASAVADAIAKMELNARV